MNRVYHKGRKRPPESAKQAWAEHRHPSYTAPLARYLGLSKAAVSKWRQVPEDRVDDVAAFLGLSRAQLRPDLFDIGRTISINDLYSLSQPKGN